MYLFRVPNSLPPRLQALALEAGDHDAPGGGHGNHDGSGGAGEHITFYEITVASADQPKLLSRLSEALVGGDCGLGPGGQEQDQQGCKLWWSRAFVVGRVVVFRVSAALADQAQLLGRLSEAPVGQGLEGAGQQRQQQQGRNSISRDRSCGGTNCLCVGWREVL